MSKKRGKPATGAMLELWRPPQNAGEPVGCLASTYTFAPGLFDEQCLARFLEIESEPNREDLAFLLERETRLGAVYAGVLVDYTQAGVEHSLRWDVLPVRVGRGKQHAKLSVLAWSQCVRVIVASANLTDPGYRTNFEVAGSVDLTPMEANTALLGEAIDFLRGLLTFVPGSVERPPEIGRAETFLDHVERQTRPWKPASSRSTVRQQLTCTTPSPGAGRARRSSLEEAVAACRKRGGSPTEVWVASPFFDQDEETSRVTASLCKLMARGVTRKLYLCIPAIRDANEGAVPRLAAPISLLHTPSAYYGSVRVEILPDHDEEKNSRQWHAKMVAFLESRYTALMIGSSNFTVAGMGVERYGRNAEANLLTIVDRVDYGREARELEALWPKMTEVSNPDAAEWLGPQQNDEEEEQASAQPLPEGFLSATYRAGDIRQIILRLAPNDLPDNWVVLSCGHGARTLLASASWLALGRPAVVELAWAPIQPPEKLLVKWGEQEAFMVLNVEDSRALPVPAQLEHMSADDMLLILAAVDPSAAIRTWARRRVPSELFDEDLDSATPVDLDPLRRYDLQATFLHRIRRRARVLAQLRANLERPVWGNLALEWRLRGLVGIEALAERLVREFASASEASDEALLTLADFLIVLAEVQYQPTDGAMAKMEFDKAFRSFLDELAVTLHEKVTVLSERVSEDVMQFWGRVVQRCQS